MIHDAIGAHDWLELSEGRVRFSGSIRSWDDSGRDTFGVDLDGRRAYGEIRRVWKDDSHWNLEVLSFGHDDRGNVGMPMAAQNPFIRRFEEQDLVRVQRLVHGLVNEFRSRDESPSIMNMDSPEEFLGKIAFRDGWALVENGKSRKLFPASGKGANNESA